MDPELDKARRAYIAMYGVDPEEELAAQGAATPSYADSLATTAPDALSPPPPPDVNPFTPDATESPVAAPNLPAPSVPVQSVSLSETTPSVVVTPKYAQTGVDNITDTSLRDISVARNPMGKAAEVAQSGLAAQGARAEDALAEATRVSAGAQTVEEADAQRRVQAADARMAEIAKFQQEAQNRVTQIDGEIKQIAETEPDPGRFWSSRSTGQKALYYITAALQAFSKPEEVPQVSSLLLKFIDDDIARQEDRIGRELDAAKGRASSVRELITADKSAMESQYALRTSRLEAMRAGAMAEWVAAGRTAAATAERDAKLAAIDGTKMQLGMDVAKSTVMQRQQNAQIALQKRELAYRMQKDAQAAQAAAQSAPENARFPSGNAVVTDAQGNKQPWVVLVKESLRENTTRAPAFDGAMSAIDDLESYVAEQQAKGRAALAISKDPEFKSRMARSVRPIAQSLGYEKNISDKEAEQLSDAIMGGAVPDSFRDTTVGAFFTTIQLNPKNIGESIGRVRQGVSGSYSSWLSTNADPNYYGAQRPDVVIPAKRPTTREQDISSTIGAKADIDARQRAVTGDVVSSFVPSQSYDAMREVARNTMDKQDVSDLAAAVGSIPEGTPERAKAQALLDRVAKVKSVNPARLLSHERDQYMMDVISLNKELGK